MGSSSGGGKSRTVVAPAAPEPEPPSKYKETASKDGNLAAEQQRNKARAARLEKENDTVLTDKTLGGTGGTKKKTVLGNG